MVHVRVIFCAFLFCSLMLIGQWAFAMSNSSLDQARFHAQRAAHYVREHGKEKALAEFNKKESQFVQNDLYVFAFSLDGIVLAHPINPELVGKNMIHLKDMDGRSVIQQLVAVKNEGWVVYKMHHPIDGRILDKTSYIINMGDMVIGVGAYRD